jgi:hypothetical protein
VAGTYIGGGTAWAEDYVCMCRKCVGVVWDRLRAQWEKGSGVED